MKNTTTIIMVSFIFLVCYVLLFNFVFDSLTNEELQELKKIAEEVYVQPNTLIETPSNVKIEKTSNYVLVKEENQNSYGFVKATLKDGELSFEENSGKSDKIFNCMLIAILLTFCFSLIILTIRTMVKSQV